ncbi:MAG: hypothetical protein PSN34_14970 [Urechidicola sp.]|nr:hypothetical protein [Urechidicola sp.]
MTPNLLKTLLTFSLLLLSIVASFGQLENPEKKIEVPVDLIQPEIEVEKHDFIDPRITDETKVEAALEKIIKDMLDAEEKAQLKNKGITTVEKIREERAKKKMGELNKNYAKIDQYLGGFSTTSESVVIVCWDFQYPDGDTVTIYINDKPVIQNIVLTNSYQQFRLPLVEGLNVISFKALNQGFSGPNTAAFKIYDENAYEISSNEWNLATGAKATLSIARVSEE